MGRNAKFERKHLWIRLRQAEKTWPNLVLAVGSNENRVAAPVIMVSWSLTTGSVIFSNVSLRKAIFGFHLSMYVYCLSLVQMLECWQSVWSSTSAFIFQRGAGCPYKPNDDLFIRGGVEDTRLEAKDTKKFRGQDQEQTLSRPRNLGHRCKCSPKKKRKGLQIFFSVDLYLRSLCRFSARFLAFLTKFQRLKNSTVLGPRTGQFSRT